MPDPYSFTGRELDHLGESNFFGGVRGKVTETTVTSTGNLVEPVAGVRFLADTNGNGKRDILNYAYDPDGFAVDTEITNAFPGVTLTTVASDGRNVGYEAVADYEPAWDLSIKSFRTSCSTMYPTPFEFELILQRQFARSRLMPLANTISLPAMDILKHLMPQANLWDSFKAEHCMERACNKRYG